MKDTEIVELYIKRDESAVRETNEKYGRKLYKMAYSVLSDKETAEECVNDALLKAWNSIPPNEPREYLLAYLLRITRQIALNRLKASSAIKRSAEFTELTKEMEECLPSGDSVADEVEEKELKEAINRFLDGLTKEKSDVFIRRYWFFDSISEIAKRMGFTKSKVKTMLFRIREELKQYLKDLGCNI